MYVELMLHYNIEGTRSMATCYANFIFVLVTHVVRHASRLINTMFNCHSEILLAIICKVSNVRWFMSVSPY